MLRCGINIVAEQSACQNSLTGALSEVSVCITYHSHPIGGKIGNKPDGQFDTLRNTYAALFFLFFEAHDCVCA